MKLYSTIQESSSQVSKLFNEGRQRGYYVGFECLKDIFSIIPGTTLYLYGAPFSGKTHVKYEFLMYLTEAYKWKHAVFDPETGTKEDIIQHLIEIYTRKKFHGPNKMSEAERMQAEMYLNDYFFIIDPGMEDMTIKKFYAECEKIEKEKKVKLNTTSIDPYDDLKEDAGEFNMNSTGADYLTEVLKYARRKAKEQSWYNIIVTHVRDQDKVKDRDSGIWYYPPPTPREIAKGQAWFRKGMAMVGIWRCPKGLCDDEGRPFEWNQLYFIPHKQKPKGVAINGDKPPFASMFWDPETGRYFERDEFGNYKYAQPKPKAYLNNPQTNEKEEVTNTFMQLNTEFDEETSTTNDLPF